MATVEFAFVKAMDLAEFGSAPVVSAYASAVETITTTASTQATTAAASNGDVCEVTASGGDVYVSFGSAPNAQTDPGRRRVLAGQTRVFGRLVNGHVGAVVDA